MSNQQSELTHSLVLIKDTKTNPLRRAYLIDELTSKQALSKKELSYLIDKSPSYISNHLRLIKLPEVIKDALLSGIISEGHARALTFIENRKEIIHLFEDIIRNNYSVRDTEKQVDKLRTYKRQYGKVTDELKQELDVFKQEWNVQAKISRQRRSIKIQLEFPVGVVGLTKLKTFFKRLANHK